MLGRKVQTETDDQILVNRRRPPSCEKDRLGTERSTLGYWFKRKDPPSEARLYKWGPSKVSVGCSAVVARALANISCRPAAGRSERGAALV
jgi:hypothetical protein